MPISEECSDKQALSTSSVTSNCSADPLPGHSWPHLGSLVPPGSTLTVPTRERCRPNGRFRCTAMIGGPAEIIAGASGCMDLSRTRVPPAQAAATFRIGLIMERGLTRQRISPRSDCAGLRRWAGR
jgi:hypothetical protein